MISRRSLTAVLLGAACLSACSSMGQLRRDPLSAGESRDFTAAYERVLQATREAIVEAGLSVRGVETVSDGTSVIMAERVLSAFSWGEYVRVVVVRSDPTRTRVRVHMKRKLSINVTAKDDYAATIFAILERTLG